MEFITKPREIQDKAREYKRAGRAVALTPTMGALHRGHATLIRRARQDCDIVVTSIFVNPAQFGPQEDYLNYPRDIENDTRLAEEAGADIVFSPSPADMYPKGFQTYIEVEKLSKGLCGNSRPGHFVGVATVVCKLLNLVKPERAYFGQKDYQQYMVIKRMAEDLNIDTEAVLMPIVREEDGLAVSSRNTYLAPRERQAAAVIFRALEKARAMIQNKKAAAENVRNALAGVINAEPLAGIDYAEIRDARTLRPLERIIPGNTLIALAVKIGKTRLIDNMIV